ncbi:MAG TPA: metallophosphoesterase, partial [Candidatus Melainabacteria bacterium]|nr:metallophosphoesterase [Candidatus Melainabacteria bacterium]
MDSYSNYQNKLKSLSLMSRRRFLTGLASVACLGLSKEAQSAVGLFEPFTFGYVTDAHLCIGQPDSYKMLQESQLFLQDVVKSLNEHRVDFTIFGGDNVEGPGRDDTNWQLFIDVVQGLNNPWNFVLGESDVSGIAPVDKMRTYGPDWKGKGIESKKSYWSQDPVAGVHVIGLDTSRTNSNTGDFSKAQGEWLKEDLQVHQRRFTIVFSHHPLLPPSPYDSGPPWDDYTVPNGANAREIFATSKYVRLAVNGHVHASKVQQENNIWYVSSPSLAVYPCAYRLFHVTPEAINIETYHVSFPALIKKAKNAFISCALAYKYSNNKPATFAAVAEGTRLDTDVSLPLVAGKTIQALEKKKPQKQKREKNKQSKSPAKNSESEKDNRSAPTTPET